MLTAIIDPNSCIGCNRCVPACPFDAIVGTHQHLHTVLTDKCIGCKLCLPPCPVDCIDIVELSEQESSKIPKKIRAQNAKEQYTQHLLRQQKKNKISIPHFSSIEEKQKSIKNEIQESILRAKKNKTSLKSNKNIKSDNNYNSNNTTGSKKDMDNQNNDEL